MTEDDHLAREMYKEHILELYKNPPRFGKIKAPSHEYRAFNPLCGDDITMQLVIEKESVKDAKFSGRGCAISIASAALLTDSLIGKTVSEVMKLSKDDVIAALKIPIGPIRLKCALLALDALQNALAKVKQ